MKKFFNATTLMAIGMIFVAALSRLIPGQLPNFNPIMALAIFGGASIADKRLALIVPLAAMFFSDIFLGFHATILAVYLSIALSVLIGNAIRNRVNAFSVVGASLAGSVIFYIITNFAYWLAFCDTTFASLMAAYVAAIPFFRNAILGDIVFSGVMFGSFALAGKYLPRLARVSAK